MNSQLPVKSIIATDSRSNTSKYFLTEYADWYRYESPIKTDCIKNILSYFEFQSQSEFCFIHLNKCNVHSLRSTSGATPADLSTAIIAAGHNPMCIRKGGSWLRFVRAFTHTEDELFAYLCSPSNQIGLKCSLPQMLNIWGRFCAFDADYCLLISKADRFQINHMCHKSLISC